MLNKNKNSKHAKTSTLSVIAVIRKSNSSKRNLTSLSGKKLNRQLAT